MMLGAVAGGRTLIRMDRVYKVKIQKLFRAEDFKLFSFFSPKEVLYEDAVCKNA